MSASAFHVAPSTRWFFDNTLTETTSLFLNFLLSYQEFEPELIHKEVILDTKTLNKKSGLGITDTLLQHRNMENLMNRSQFTRKFQFIGNFTNLLQDFIGTHIMRTQFLLLAKSNHPFHRWDFQIHLITFFKLLIPSPMIGIRLLPTIGRLQPVPHDMNFFESLIHQIETKKWRLTHFKPSYRIPTPPSIQGFIRSHGNEWMKTIVIGKLHQR